MKLLEMQYKKQKVVSMFLLTIMTLGFILPSIKVNAQNFPAITTIPSSSKFACQSAVNQVVATLDQKGFYRYNGSSINRFNRNPSVKIDQDFISQRYVQYPRSRLETLHFYLAADPVRLWSGLQSSPKFMASQSAIIFSSCPKIGLVIFYNSFEGMSPVGYYSDNTARVFQWINNSREPWQWGYFYSP